MISIIQQSKNPRFIRRCNIFRQSHNSPKGPLFSPFSTRYIQSLNYNRDTGIISSTTTISADTSNDDEPNQNVTNQSLFHTIIGIEIHAQLSVPTKLFSPSPTKHNSYLASFNTTAIPNSSISLHDIGYPGTLPLISKKSIQYAVLSAAALNCQIQHTSRFERKHYFYPDLPLGYQVTQQRWPLAKDGELSCRRYIAFEDQKQQQKKKKSKKKQRKEELSENNDEPKNNNKQELSKFFNVGIDRIQIEQDTGKTTTITNDSEVQLSLIDFNRAGCTLIEVVFKPQIKSAHEAASVASTVQSLLKHIKTCDGKMEDGSLRVDLNISIAPMNNDNNKDDDNAKATISPQECDNPFQKYLPPGVGKRVEVKNLNSLKQIIQSVEYEGIRQAQRRLNGDTINQETRTFDPKTGQTIKIRDKGGAVDYRFMPEPDLPPLVLDDGIFDGKSLDEFIDDELPELPEQAIGRLMEEYGLHEATALIIASDRPAIGLYEAAVKVCIDSLEDDEQTQALIKDVPIVVGNWLCNDLFALVKESAMTRESDDSMNIDNQDDDGLVHPISMEYSQVNAQRLGLLIALILDGTISTTQGKKILDVMYKEDLVADPGTIADERGWKLISNLDELKELCQSTVLDPSNEKQFNQYKQGGKHVRKMKKFFVGKVMASSRGNAHPELLKDALDAFLDEVAPGVQE